MIELLGIELSWTVIVIGAITGLTYAAFGAGFVLIYRSTGVLNFAHGEMGAFGLTLFVLLVSNYDVNWWLAFVLSIAGCALAGAVAELVVVRRLFTSPRLVLLIATIGIAQILLLARVLWLPEIQGAIGPVPTAFTTQWTFGDLTLNAREIIVVAIVPPLIGALGLFLTRTRFGLAVRASASNPDTARVFGTSPRQVSTIVWAISGAFAAATAILIAPLDAIPAAFVAEPSETLAETLLLRVLVVSLLARMRSLVALIWAGPLIGVIEAIIESNVASTNLDIVELYLFLGVLGVVLWLARSQRETGSWSLSPRATPVPERLRTIWWVRHLNHIGFAFLFGLLALLPLIVTSSSGLFVWTQMLIWSMVALSLTVLTGWSGQLSLGQFAFVGIGGGTTLAVSSGHDIPIPFDLFDLSLELPWGLAIITGTVVGVIAAVLVGLPALRVRGLFLAVVTLAFAVAAASWILSQDVFTGGTTLPRSVEPPWFLVTDDGDVRRRGLYYLCLVALIVMAWMAARIRATGVGRSFIAVRDNEEMAAASTVPPAAAKLSAFAVSGGMAAFAGGLFMTTVPTWTPHVSFAASESIQVVVISIIGGLGSIAGPVLGTLWVRGLPEVTPDRLLALQQLFTSDLGLLVLLMYFPGGLLQIVYSGRDALLRRAEASLPDEPAAAPVAAVAKQPPTRGERARFAEGVAALRTEDIEVRFGGNVAVNGVSFEVRQGELVGLIGTNGAGKSTLLNAVSGFVPSTGSVFVNGTDVTALPAAQRHQVGLGRGFQAARLYPDLTVRESLQVALEARERSPLIPSMLGLPPSPARERRKAAEADEIIDFLGLGRYADQATGNLSTGTRRIVELGSLLAVDASVLLLDEPTGGVAQRETEAFGPLIKRIQQELDAAVVVIEHDMPLVMSISDRVYCLESGIVIAEGTPDEVRDDDAVISSYLGTDERAIHRSNS